MYVFHTISTILLWFNNPYSSWLNYVYFRWTHPRMSCDLWRRRYRQLAGVGSGCHVSIYSSSHSPVGWKEGSLSAMCRQGWLVYSKMMTHLLSPHQTDICWEQLLKKHQHICITFDKEIPAQIRCINWTCWQGVLKLLFPLWHQFENVSYALSVGVYEMSAGL